MDIQLGDTLVMKKEHPCGSKEWKVLRVRPRDHGPPIQGGEKYSPSHQEYLDRMKRQPWQSAAAFSVLEQVPVESNWAVGETVGERLAPTDLFFLVPVLY